MRLMALSPKLGKRNIVLHFALRNISFQLKAIVFITIANTSMLRSFPTFVRGVCIFIAHLKLITWKTTFHNIRTLLKVTFRTSLFASQQLFFSTEDYVHNGSSKGSKTQREQINNARSPNNRKQQKEIGIYFPSTTTTYNMTEIFSLDSGTNRTMFFVDYQEKTVNRKVEHVVTSSDH